MLSFSQIVGFFCKIAEIGRRIQVKNLSHPAMCNLSRTTRVILELQATSANPHFDRRDLEHPPEQVVTALAVKSKIRMTDTLLSSGFHLAFALMTNRCHNSKDHN